MKISPFSRGIFAAAWLLLAGWNFEALAAVDWPTLGFTQVVTNYFIRPTYITHAGDGSQRLFVAEQRGLVWIIQSNSVLQQPFLNVSNRVFSAGAEQGLLGLAFPPGFSTNQHLYVDYTISSNNAVVISRFQLTTNANVADPNSEQVILVIPKPYNNHNAGQLAFGPDGYLYIGVGDGGSEGDPKNIGQNTGTLLGKILRIDVESGVSPYAVPTNNPFVGNTNYVPETWAYGLRNPWRFSFDRLTGDLYIADVGQNAWEEIDFQPAGGAGGQNYGWRIMEGPTNYNVPSGFTNFQSLTLPVAWYSHNILPTDAAGAVIGGYAYRGPNMPRLNGVYFYGDFIAGWIWGLKQDGTNWQSVVLTNPVPPTPYFAISTFGEDDQGQLYLADYGRGYIWQIQDSLQLWAPAFSPTGGTINSNLVRVTCNSTNPEIHWTTNGVDPTLADPIVPVTGLIAVSTGATNKVKAFRSDLPPSGVATAIFTLQVGSPIFTPPAGSITNNTFVSISSATPFSTIYYTTDGSTPTTNSLPYGGPIMISGGATLRAIGVATGYINSAVATASYSAILAATPTFSPPAGFLTNTTGISILCATVGATIRYTTDGSIPTTNSAVYSSPVVISVPTTLKAIAYRSDLGPSSVQSAFYAFVRYDQTVVTTYAGSSTAGLSNAVRALAQFSGPSAICFDNSGNMLVADSGNFDIRLVPPSGMVQTLAGSGVLGHQDGSPLNAQFADTAGICRDSHDNVFVADGYCGWWTIRKIDTGGNVTTVSYVSSVCDTIGQLAIDPLGNLFAGYGNALKEIAPNGTITGLAVYNGDFVGVGIDPLTNIYVATPYQLWKRAADGTQTLLAGSSSGAGGFSDGPSQLALFQSLRDAAVDLSGNVFVSDQTRVRRISPSGSVSTVAGSGTAGYANGRGYSAQFSIAAGLCLDTNGNVYVADPANHCVRKISPDTAGIGIADDWQIAYFGHVGIDPNADPDHDGMSNYEEFWAGTDPLDPNSALRIDNTSLTSSGHAQIQWQTVAGKTYNVQFSTDLISWINVGGPTQGDGTIASVIDPAAVSQTGQGYYRVALTGF